MILCWRRITVQKSRLRNGDMAYEGSHSGPAFLNFAVPPIRSDSPQFLTLAVASLTVDNLAASGGRKL